MRPPDLSPHERGRGRILVNLLGTASGSELDGVAQKVDQCPSQLVFIAEQLRQVRSDLTIKLQLFAIGQ